MKTIVKPEGGYIIVDGIECPFSVVDDVACLDLGGVMLEEEHLIAIAQRLKEMSLQWAESE